VLSDHVEPLLVEDFILKSTPFPSRQTQTAKPLWFIAREIPYIDFFSAAITLGFVHLPSIRELDKSEYFFDEQA
jgi:hypothetical protein